MSERYLVIGFTAKGGPSEFTSIKGYVLDDGDACPSYESIRKDSLMHANSDGGNFSFFQMNFMNFMSEADYKSLFGVI
ncbi:MAG: hypothetical protein ACRCXB_10530 [Aeromonadaceae bacterium]